MQKFEVALASQGGDAVVTAHTLNLGFQPAFNGSDSLSDGNLTINGKQSLCLANGQCMEVDLPPINIRLKEVEEQLATMPAGAAKTALQAKFNIWSNALASIQSALATALIAQHELDHPVEA